MSAIFRKRLVVGLASGLRSASAASRASPVTTWSSFRASNSSLQGHLAAARPPLAAWSFRSMSHGHGHSHGGDHDGPTVPITFIYEKDGSSHTVEGAIGMSVLRVAHAHGIDLEGACEASLACSTCHVVLEEPLYDSLEEPSDDENDMLDLAFALTDTSRLGCQVIVTEDMAGSVFKIPSATRNMYVDGHVPKPH